MPNINDILVGFEDLIKALREELSMKDMEIAILTARLDESRMGRIPVDTIVLPVKSENQIVQPVREDVLQVNEVSVVKVKKKQKRYFVDAPCMDCKITTQCDKYRLASGKDIRCKECLSIYRSEQAKMNLKGATHKSTARLQRALDKTLPVDYSGV